MNSMSNFIAVSKEPRWMKPLGMILSLFGLIALIPFKADYLDDFGRGAWYGGDYEAWGEALDASYFDVNTGQELPLTPEQISRVPAEANLFTPRATNNMMDGYMQFHIGIARRF